MSNTVPGVKVSLDRASRLALEQLAAQLSLSQSATVRLALLRLAQAEGLRRPPSLLDYLADQHPPNIFA